MRHAIALLRQQGQEYRCSATQGAALDLSAVRVGRHQSERTPRKLHAPEEVGC